VKPPSAAALSRYHLVNRLAPTVLKIAADIEIGTCGWIKAAIATCQRLTPVRRLPPRFFLSGRRTAANVLTRDEGEAHRSRHGAVARVP
jgi:hypothetical protein